MGRVPGYPTFIPLAPKGLRRQQGCAPDVCMPRYCAGMTAVVLAVPVRRNNPRRKGDASSFHVLALATGHAPLDALPHGCEALQAVYISPLCIDSTHERLIQLPAAVL
eukprot:scaffold705_cov402-Prasinococcus_capsulatus_cf.AAC.10